MNRRAIETNLGVRVGLFVSFNELRLVGGIKRNIINFEEVA